MTTVYLATGPFGAGGQFFGLGGLPLNLGTITTYAAGTTTPLATYTTSAGSVQNANPIVLGTDGRPPNEIWVTSDFYRFDLKDSLGNLIKTYDNLGGAYVDAASLASTASPTLGDYLEGVKRTLTGAVATNQHVVNEYRAVDVIVDYAATGLGVADDSTAINAAITGAVASTGTSSVGYGARFTVRLPKGLYKLSSSIVASAYLNLDLSEAVLLPDAGVDAITNVTYMTRIKGGTIVGGRDGISLATSNADSTVIVIDGTTFLNQTRNTITDDSASFSTHLILRDVKWYNTNHAATLTSLTVDKTTIIGGWAESSCDVSFQNGDGTHSGSHLTISGLLGVPLGTASAVWVKNYGTFTANSKTRFGGENSGYIICQNEAAADVTTAYVPNAVIVDDCECYAASKYAFVFNALPNMVRITNNRGFSDCLGINISASITDATIALLGPDRFTWTVNGNVFDTDQTGLPLRVGAKPALAASVPVPFSVAAGIVVVADKILEIQQGTASFGPSQSGTTTETNPTNVFGSTLVHKAWTAAGQNFQWYYTTALNGFATGLYTLVFEFNVTTTHVVEFSSQVSGTKKRHSLPKGKYVINHPFYFISGTSAEDIGVVALGGFDTQGCEFGNFRIFAGHLRVPTVNNVCYGTAAPAALRWQIGDRVIQSTPTVGQPKAWVCTVSGTPGTWVSEGNL